jgi:hypothetical protein
VLLHQLLQPVGRELVQPADRRFLHGTDTGRVLGCQEDELPDLLQLLLLSRQTCKYRLLFIMQNMESESESLS